MMRKKSIITKLGARAIAGILTACMTFSLAGCGETARNPEETESIELLNPVGVAFHYEKAAKRTIYKTTTYSALICPYAEEYEFSSSQVFEDYTAYPGQSVKKGQTLLKSNTESVDKQIEDLTESMKQAAEEMEEYLKEANEALEEIAKKRDMLGDMMHKAQNNVPPQTITVTDPATGAVTEVSNPDYEVWNSQYTKLDTTYRVYYIDAEKRQQAISQKTELYNLDTEYRKKLLARLKQDRGNSTVDSKMDGVVAAIRYLDNNQWVSGETPLVAVADLDRKEMKCDYINKSTVAKAKDLYAIIHGKRYEIEYQAMDTDEYKRIQEENGKVYSTFYLKDDAEVEIGTYAVIVIVEEKNENVVAVPKDAVKRDSTSQYVYVVNGTELVYTPVKTGISDGVYTEIVSGLEEGANVLTEQASKITGNRTAKLEKGSINYNFSSTGYLTYPSYVLEKNPVEYGTVYFVENYVSMYQQVKKGDVLAKVRVVPDTVQLEKNEQKLVREKERLAELIAEQEKDEYQKQIEAKQENIADLEELIADMKADFQVKEIKASINGIVTGINSYEAESLVRSGDAMYQISDETKSFLFVVDDRSQLTYGNEVTVTYKGSNGMDTQVTGEVVSLNQMVASRMLTTDNKVTTGWNNENAGAIIQLSPEIIGQMAGSTADDSGWWSRSAYTVTAEIRNMENVLLVPKGAVKEKDGATYVNVKLEDGSIESRSFIAGGSNNSYYWCVEGLTEGMEICLE